MPDRSAASTCLISLGANLGDRRATLQAALRRLASSASINQLRISSLYETTPIGGPGGQQGFLNAAARFQTTLAAGDLLQLLQTIESDAGRTRGARWAARTLDLDLLLYGDEVIQTETLTVPHPRLTFRRFVLEPAAEIAGEMIHSPTGYFIAELLARLDWQPTYFALAGSLQGNASHVAAMLAQEHAEEILLVTDPTVHEPLTSENFLSVGMQTDEARETWQRRAMTWYRERFADLNAAQATTQDQTKAILSDFWIGRCPWNLPTEEPSTENHDQIEELFNQAGNSDFLEPTLLIWLQRQAPITDPRDSIFSPGAPTPGVPTLIVPENDPQWAKTEVAAALAAINDHPRRLPASDTWPPPADRR